MDVEKSSQNAKKSINYAKNFVENSKINVRVPNKRTN